MKETTKKGLKRTGRIVSGLVIGYIGLNSLILSVHFGWPIMKAAVLGVYKNAHTLITIFHLDHPGWASLIHLVLAGFIILAWFILRKPIREMRTRFEIRSQAKRRMKEVRLQEATARI